MFSLYKLSGRSAFCYELCGQSPDFDEASPLGNHTLHSTCFPCRDSESFRSRRCYGRFRYAHNISIPFVKDCLGRGRN